MDMNSLFRGVLPTVAANATAAAENASNHGQMHASIIESILPMLGLRGLLPMYGFIGNWLGLDPTWLLTTIGMLWACNKLGRQIYHTGYGFITEHMMSNIHISSNDDIYAQLMRWLAMQPGMVNSRSLTAETVSKTAWEDEDDPSVSRDQSGVYLNFSNQEARAVSTIRSLNSFLHEKLICE